MFTLAVRGLLAISILPYLDQAPLYNKYDFNVTNESAANQVVRETPLAAQNCPSDPNAGKKDLPASGPGSGLNYASSSYRAVNGMTDQDNWPDNSPTNNPKWFGLMHTVSANYRTETVASCTDGLSSTLLLGEYSTQTQPRRRTFWAYTYTSFANSTICPACGNRTLLNDYDKCAAIAGVGGSNACKRGWGSFHVGGIQYLMGDGAVRFISVNIDMKTLGALATMANSEVVGEF
jgi:hypothetical protein